MRGPDVRFFQDGASSIRYSRLMKRLIIGMSVQALIFASVPFACFAQKTTIQGNREMKKLTPVIIVEEIEPCLSFWVDRLGFRKTLEVPEGNKIGFVILVKDSVEIMYQSRASVAKDVGVQSSGTVPPLTGSIKLGQDRVTLYIEVEKLDSVIQALKGFNVILPERKTFYGAREFGVREPGGTIVVFSELAHSE
jgi:uncharacterized glyoxalase superfamily protein PhnB